MLWRTAECTGRLGVKFGQGFVTKLDFGMYLARGENDLCGLTSTSRRQALGDDCLIEGKLDRQSVSTW